MTVQNLIDKLKTFDPNHPVIMEVWFDNSTRKTETTIDDIQWKNNHCVLYGEDY